MSQQIQITGGAKVRNLEGVITGTSGVLSSVPLGAANGVATLDSGGKVPVSQLPSSVVTYLGTWNAATNTPTLANGTGDAGDMYLCNVAGTVNFGAGPVVFVVGDWVLYGSGTWQKSNGQNGTVTSVGLSTNAGAITIGSSPITTSGTITANFNGTNLQYVNGAGNLTTFPILTGYVTAVSGTAPVVSSGGTTPAISMAAATGSVDGYLLATDFAIFSAKQSALTFSSPLVNTSGTISIPAATTSVNGYLASADFTTFNNKQNAITLTTTGTSGASTLVGATLNIPNYGSALTGYVPYTGATQDVDLGAFKLNAQSLHAKGTAGLGHLGLKHQSASATASANEVSLFADSLGDLSWLNGNLYLSKFITSGNTAARSYTFPNANGTLALTSDISYPVTSVFGRTGAVVATSGDYTTAQVTESGNLYFTDSRARLALSFVAGSGAYNSTTGVITIPTNNTQITNGSAYITLTSLSGSTGISYNNTTGAISSTITQYTDALARLAISLTTTGTSGAATYNNTTGVLNIPQYIGGVTSVFGRTGAVVATEGDYSLTQLSDVTITSPTTGQVLKYNGTAWINDTDANSGTVTSVAMTVPTGLSVSGSPITTSGTLGVTFAAGYSIPTDASQTTWDSAYTNRITSLTVTGASGAATLVSNVLNIPTYTLTGLGGQPLATNLTSLAGLTFVSTSFVKMTAAGTFALDTNTYQGALTLTTTGTSGASTLVGNTLNIPQYSGGGTITLSAIGSTPNANGATLTGSALNLEPASASFGGVVTTGTQTFAGVKAFNNNVGIGSSTIYNGGGFGNVLSIFNTTSSAVSLVTSSRQLQVGLFNANFTMYDVTSAVDRFTIIGTTGNIGINTTSVGSKLQVNGNAAIGYSTSTAAPTYGLAVSGNVGIGTNSPAEMLDLNITTTGDAAIRLYNLQSSYASAVAFKLKTATQEFHFGLGGGSRTDIATNAYYIVDQTNGKFRFVTKNNGDFALGGNILTALSQAYISATSSALAVTLPLTLATTANASTIASTGYSLTGANAQSLLDLSGTWNTTGNPTAIKLNITNTASGSTSNLMDLQVGAVSKFKVDKTGAVTATSFFESSDSRLKTLIQDNYQTKGIALITPKLYTKNGKVELGYYAQDFVGVLDSAVSKGSDDMLSLSYREVLVAKVYALEQRIKELETK